MSGEFYVIVSKNKPRFRGLDEYLIGFAGGEPLWGADLQQAVRLHGKEHATLLAKCLPLLGANGHLAAEAVPATMIRKVALIPVGELNKESEV